MDMRTPVIAAATVLVALSGTGVAEAAFPGVNGRAVVGTGAGEIFVGDVNVTNTPGDFDTEATWSPDGTRIAFSSSRQSGNRQWRDIWVMDASGANPRKLTSTGNGTYTNENPSWSPDGRKLVYTASTDTTRELRVIGLDGAAPVPLVTTPNTTSGQARWSPDGSRIVFVQATYGGRNWDLWIVDADGSDLKDLTNTPQSESSPTFSPDGKQVAYGVRENEQDLHRLAFMVRAVDDGTTTRRVTPSALGSNPVWSADGAWLGYLDGSTATPMMV